MSKKATSTSSKKPAKMPAKKRSKQAARPATKRATPSARTRSTPPKGRAKTPASTTRAARSPAPTASAVSQRASTLVRFAHKMLADMAGGIPDDRATSQLAGAYNHKLWTLGHLADSNQWFAWLIDGQPMTLPAEWNRLFGMGSTPQDDAAIYPPIADVRAAFEASVDRLCAAIEAHTDAELGGPPAGDGAGFVHDKLDSAFKAVWHYGWHLGQVAALRKGLGVPALQRA